MSSFQIPVAFQSTATVASYISQMKEIREGYLSPLRERAPVSLHLPPSLKKKIVKEVDLGRNIANLGAE